MQSAGQSTLAATTRWRHSCRISRTGSVADTVPCLALTARLFIAVRCIMARWFCVNAPVLSSLSALAKHTEEPRLLRCLAWTNDWDVKKVPSLSIKIVLRNMLASNGGGRQEDGNRRTGGQGGGGMMHCYGDLFALNKPCSANYYTWAVNGDHYQKTPDGGIPFFNPLGLSFPNAAPHPPPV